MIERSKIPVAAEREMIVQDLLRHTAGLAYGEITVNAPVRDAAKNHDSGRSWTVSTRAREGECELGTLAIGKRCQERQNPQLLVTDGIGGSPYGPGTLAGTDGSRQPVEAELTTARNLGSRLARVAGRLKDLRVSRASAP
jgi:multimeric flavodoxin WrbA